MFDQAVRRLMIMDDPARNTLIRQHDEEEAPLSVIPHPSHYFMGSEEEEEWILCELADRDSLNKEC